MKKRFISLVAAAALVGGVAAVSVPTAANAGTVAVKGDTQATLYGFVWTDFTWANQAGGDLDSSDMPLPAPNSKSSKLYKSSYNETEALSNVWTTRLGLAFKNEDANLNGRLETDFWGGGRNANGNLRIRRAYVQHNLDNFYVLVGQEWIMEENFASISSGFTAPAGFDEGMLRKPQVRIGTNFDLGSAKLDLALAFEWENSSAVSSSDDAGTWTATEVNRYVFPATVAKGVLHFETGFGAPAKFYAWGSLIPVYVSSSDDSYVDESETSYAFGTGVSVPVSMVTIGGNFQYSDGATNYAGVTGGFQPASYYVKNGDDEDTEMYAWNANVQFKPMPCLTVGAEYDYVEFKNDSVFNGDEPEVQTFVGNVKINTTKYTQLALEWRHMKAKDFDKTGLTTDDDFSGDQIAARYMYKF